MLVNLSNKFAILEPAESIEINPTEAIAITPIWKNPYNDSSRSLDISFTDDIPTKLIPPMSTTTIADLTVIRANFCQ